MRKTHQGTLRLAVLDELDKWITARQDSAKLISQAFSTYLERTFAAKLDPARVATRRAQIRLRARSPYSRIPSTVRRHLVGWRRFRRPHHWPILAAQAHKIHIYSDASAALASSNIDVVLLGADRIAASGAVSNKTGSLPAALSAKHVSPLVKTVVLGDSDKIALPGRPEDHVDEDNDAAQLSRAWQAEYNSGRIRSAATKLLNAQSSSETDITVRIETRNVFFEWVPARLVDAYVTEFGEWTGHQMSQQSAKLEAEEKRFFGSL